MTTKEDILQQYKQVEKQAWNIFISSEEPLQKRVEALQFAVAARFRIDKIEMYNER